MRLFNYPSRPVSAGTEVQWGVGEHTDYELFTILWQDEVGGLQVRTGLGDADWVDAPPIPGSFVCNLGDRLDRLSIPFFVDPDFDARVQPVPGSGPGQDGSGRRWDGANLQAFEGT